MGTNLVLLLLLYHSPHLTNYYGAFLAAAICTLSICFSNSGFPSRTSLAYSCLGTITLIRIHVFILVVNVRVC